MHIQIPLLFRVLLPVLLLQSATAQAAEDTHWKAGEVTERDGFTYQVFSKASDGDGFLRYQARGTIAATPDVLIEAVRSVVSDPALAPDGQTRRVIAQDGQGFTVYTHIDLPALFSDRDIVTRGVGRVEDTGERRIDWSAIEHDAVPPVDGTIRIANSQGFWSFVPDGEGRSAAVYDTYVDLGGSLPGWLIGPMMAGMVGKTYEDVVRTALGD